MKSPLRKKLRAEGYTIEDLKGPLGFDSVSSINKKLGGQLPWRMGEVYTLMNMLRLPYSQIAVYFPPAPGQLDTALDDTKEESPVICPLMEKLQELTAAMGGGKG